jgi:hypothetical protein
VSLKKGGELLPREGIIYDAGEIEGIKWQGSQHAAHGDVDKRPFVVG